MKILILFLFAASVHADVWEPHEKELIALLWKAEHTPEMKLHKNYKIEQMKISRSYVECEKVHNQAVFFKSVSKLWTLSSHYLSESSRP